MLRSNARFLTFAGAGFGAVLACISACGSSGNGTTGGSSSGASSGTGSGGSSGSLIGGSSGGGSSGTGSSGGGIPCPTGLQCDVQCPNGSTTTITGKVYDPAGKNPLYDVAVYVPAIPLEPLPKGVPTGNDACNCGALFQSGAVTNTTTAVDGSFTLKNVPVGAQVPLVIQIGKWRRQFKVAVNGCADNPQADKSLAFPSTVAAGDTDTSIPDIAVSTGNADELECLMKRIGLKETEYVAGGGATGHVHVFSGGKAGGGGGGGGVGKVETHPMPNAPVSSTSLWSSQAQLMTYDIVLLSCEGGETYNANPSALEAYLNAGGRAFASHFHYAWFAGPLSSTQAYSSPAKWGNHLASWTAGGGQDTGPIGGTIETTLNGGNQPFAKGQALQQWLTLVNALGKNNVPGGELSIYDPRYNAVVSTANTASQAWITSDNQATQPGQTMYFSFDTPVDAPAGPNGAPPNYCGRAVFSDLHVSGDPSVNDTPNQDTGSPAPGGCGDGDLSPQEKALEFMLFDLSSCVIPDTVAPPQDGGLPPPPPK
jgi:hypothetical protein